MPKFVIVLALVALALACGSNEAMPDVVEETGPVPTTVSDNQRPSDAATRPAVPAGSTTTDAAQATPAESEAADSVQVGDGSGKSEYSDVAALRDQLGGEPVPASEDAGVTKGMDRGIGPGHDPGIGRGFGERGRCAPSGWVGSRTACGRDSQRREAAPYVLRGARRQSLC